MGSFLYLDARYCQWNLQLVGEQRNTSLYCSNAIISQLLNEIMPMIYKRFTEKAAEEWRQIYKVYTLLAAPELVAHVLLGPSASRVSR